MTVSRPALRYLGGKFRMAPWIIEQFPPHLVYIEPFGGGASVLLRKPRAKVEIYNDLDDDVVNLFQVLRDPVLGPRLIDLVSMTPFARAEFDAAYVLTDEPVERARRLVVRSFMGHGSNASRIDRSGGFRGINLAAGTPSPPRVWTGYPAALVEVIERLQGVAIEQKPAQELIALRDGPEVLFYVDPPYVQATRSQKRTRGTLWTGYVHELTDAEHVDLLALLNGITGMAVVSGYDHPIYAEGLKGWTRREKAVLADGSRPRVEVIWINPAAVAAASGVQPCLLEHSA